MVKKGEDIEILKKRLKSFQDKDIIITEHAEWQAFVRGVNLKEVRENITNPKRLVYARKQMPLRDNEEKLDCYFVYSKHLYHRYIITFNRKIIIVTIIKINRDWQKAIG